MELARSSKPQNHLRDLHDVSLPLFLVHTEKDFIAFLVFRDGSIGQSFSVSVVRIEQISSIKGNEDDDSPPGLGFPVLSHDADAILDEFCLWQMKHRQRSRVDERYDLAVLVTRTDLCRRKNTTDEDNGEEDHLCSTLGMGECSPSSYSS